MEWNIYWTLIWQLVIACLVLAFPLSLMGFFMSSAVSSGKVKRQVDQETLEPVQK